MRAEARQKIVPAGPGVHRAQGCKEGWAIAFMGGDGAWPPQGSELGKALQGLSGSLRGGAGKVPPKNSVCRSGGQMPEGRREGFAIALTVGGRGDVAFVGLRIR